ncbi:MAG TPA: SDR family oxidoreductase, partial [Bacteroidia bacterium]|nr:SDR family oxidoreductase [Bacteroidia bacterium]
MSEPLLGKVAFISGGSRGIGRATALKLAAAGCDVAILYYNSHAEAETVCGQIREMGRKAVAVQADVSNPGSVEEAFGEFRKTFDRVDLVVSNAALGVLKPAMEMGVKHFRRCMETNALALNTLAQNAVPLMRDGGAIIGLTSLGSERAIPNYTFIGASKA